MRLYRGVVRYFDYLLPLIFVLVSGFLIGISNILFWFFAPLVIGMYFWRRYHFWIFLITSAVLYPTGYFVGAGTGFFVNMAFDLLVVGALLGVVWLAERAVTDLKRRNVSDSRVLAVLRWVKSDWFAFLVIALFVIVIGAYFGALTGAPLGDDAYLHVGKALFVRNDFPNTNWYPNWYLGLDMFQTYPPTYYFMVATINFLTSLPITGLVVALFFFAMFLTGFAVYKLSKGMGLPNYLSLGFSLAWLSLPIVWGETITGGAYLRSFAAPFYILSIVAAYGHVTSINNGKPSRKAFFASIFLLSFAALLHEAVGFFAVSTVFLIYLLAIKGFKQKLKTLLVIFVPVAGLISWWYLPMLSFQFSFNLLSLNDLTLTSFQGLSTLLTPILLPLALFLSGIFIFVLVKNKGFNVSYEKKALLVIFALLSLYFVLFASFPMPANWYLMAAYDYAIWFGISLMLFTITLSSILWPYCCMISANNAKNGIGPFGKALRKLLPTILVLLIAMSFLVSLPTIYPDNMNPNNPSTLTGALYSDLGKINTTQSENYRLTAITRRVYAINQYTYPELDFTGGRQLGSYHGYYDSIFGERVLFRYHEDQNAYTEEKLPIHSTVPYSMDNYYSSMFWMDWYGVNGVLAAPFEQSLRTYNGYYERPQFYNTTKFATNSTYITYNGSSPILEATNASIVGVIDDDATYNALFQTLGELDVNSQTIIPVKLEIANLQQNLQFITTVFVNTDRFQTYQNTLENYVKSGGNLVIMNYNPETAIVESARLMQSGLIFSTYASPLTNVDNSSQAIATTSQGTIISRSTLGKGLITESSVSLQELYQEASPEASAVLASILLPNLNISSFVPGNIYVNPAVRAKGNVTSLNNEEILQGQIGRISQVTYKFPLASQVSTSSTGFIQFEMWNQGLQPVNMSLNLVNSKGNASLTYNFNYTQWTGWKTFSIPLASFIGQKGNSTLKQFNQINLVLANSRIFPSQVSYNLKIQNFAYYEIASNPNYTPLTSDWVQPNLMQVSLENSSTPVHLLWKETYDAKWQITVDGQSAVATSFYAGPGVMLICIPPNVSSVQFFQPLSSIQEIGITVSIITLIALVILATYKYLPKLPQKLKTKR